MAILGRKLPAQLSSSAVPTQADPQVISFVPYPCPFQGLQSKDQLFQQLLKSRSQACGNHIWVFCSMFPLWCPWLPQSPRDKPSSNTPLTLGSFQQLEVGKTPTEPPALQGAIITHWLGLAKPVPYLGFSFLMGQQRAVSEIARVLAGTDILRGPPLLPEELV